MFKSEILKMANDQNLVVPTSRHKSPYYIIKQIIDTLFSLWALFILSPLFIVVAVFIRLESKGPIFYKQERIGFGGKPFMIIKFRTMQVDAEKNGPQWAYQNDSRITRVGHYLRKYRIDEIPQFINILRGEMSLIGPRPERNIFIEEFEKELPYFRTRLQVKPGATGWAQINGGYDLSPKEKLAYDLYYIDHYSFALDCFIALKSIPVILFAKGWR